MPSQRLPGPHSGVKQTLTSGDPLSRSMGQYGKGHDPLHAAANAGLPAAEDEHQGAGVISSRPRFGEMGPGKDDTTGKPMKVSLGVSQT